MSHLIIQNLTKTVGDKTLFQNIEFTIYEGSVRVSSALMVQGNLRCCPF